MSCGLCRGAYYERRLWFETAKSGYRWEVIARPKLFLGLLAFLLTILSDQLCRQNYGLTRVGSVDLASIIINYD